MTEAGRAVSGLTVYGRHYANGEPIRLVTRGDRIERVEPAWPSHRVDDWPWVSPALLDLQINGFGGTWFSDEALTSDAVLAALAPSYQFGITRLCPTLITNSHAALAAGFAAIRQACESAPWADRIVCGCHLEGPYISAEDGPRGAHPKQHVRAADWGEFQQLQELSGRRIRLVTVAPEVDGVLEFTRHAVASGVVVAIGHTAATPEQIHAVVDAGATLSTHLGNGSSAHMHRHRNVVFAQLSESRLSASLIVDGHHLPPDVVRTFVRCKSPAKIILTCDAAGWAGCPPGVYENALGRSELLESGKLVVAGQRELLAGSAQETDTCVARVMEFTGVSLKAAIDMAGKNPAQLLGQEVVRLRRGARADLILFHLPQHAERLQIQATIASGELKYGTLSSN